MVDAIEVQTHDDLKNASRKLLRTYVVILGCYRPFASLTRRAGHPDMTSVLRNLSMHFVRQMYNSVILTKAFG
jgi:hypothetical protein